MINIMEDVHICSLTLNLYPRKSHNTYWMDSWSVLIPFTFTATIGIIIVTCDGVGDNSQQSLRVVAHSNARANN